MIGCSPEPRMADVTTIRVKVKPGSRLSTLSEGENGDWVAHLKAPPVDGKANRELIELVADRFGCKRSDVSIKSGAGARIKLVAIGAARRS